jgi:RNA polymerase sigma-70 factor (ECF subfamily)
LEIMELTRNPAIAGAGNGDTPRSPALDALCERLKPPRVRRNALYNRGMDQGQSAGAADARQETALRALIERIARRDQAALAEFYDATAARAYALARRLTRDPSEAEEVVADVYWQVWSQAERYQPSRGPVAAWLLVICRTRALDRLRRRDAADTHPEPDSLRPDLYRDEADPPDLLELAERSSRVHAALAALGERERALLGLAFFEDLSHQEIAARTGLPLGTVKTVLRRAILALRERLAAATL